MKNEHLTMWWDEAEGEAHDALINLINELRDREPNRFSQARVHQDIYEGSYLFSDENGDAVNFISESGVDRSQLNFTRSAVDYVHAKVTAQRPAVKAATHDGDWTQALRARKLTRFLAGQSNALQLDEKAPLALHMALRTGTGVLKVSAVDGSVQLDVVPIEELVVDPAEARYGKPPHIYQNRAVPRTELLARFADDHLVASAIEGAERPRDAYDRRIPDEADVIDVYEGWQLPDADGENGRHVVAIRGATLVDEEWLHPRFPFAFIHDSPAAPGRGFWGQGLVKRLLPVQWEIDQLVGQINQALRIGARLKVFVEKGSGVNVDHLADPAIGTLIEYESRMPTFVTPEPVPRELLEHLRFMIEQLFSQAGMSQDAASSMKPAGLSSGVALLHYHDFQTQRHIDLAKRYSRFVVDVNELFIDRARDLAEQEEDWSAGYSRGSVVNRINWSDVNMDRDAFILELEAVSPVPDSYSGRLQMIEQFASSGRLPDSFVSRLLEDPDTVRMNRMLAADASFVDFIIEMLLDPEQPMPIVMDEQNLSMTIDLVRAALMDAVPEGAPQDVVDRFQQYLNDCAARVQSLQPAQPATPVTQPVLPTQ